MNKTKYLIFIILALALVLRLYFFVGVNLNDDTEYSDAAYRLATGRGLDQYAIGSIDSIRFLMVLPVALSYKFLGVSDFSSVLYPLLCSIATIFVSFLIAKNLFNLETAFGTALILTFFPLDIVYCTQLVPPVPLALALVTCLFCFIKGDQLIERNKTLSYFLFLWSGIMLGLGWMINEPAPLFAIIIFFYIFLNWLFSSQPIKPVYLLFILGALGVFMLEANFFYYRTGDYLWRLKTIQAEELRVPTNTALDYYPRTFFKIKGLNFSYHEGHFGFFWFLLIPSILTLGALKKTGSFFLIISLIVIMSYFQFGVMTSTGKPIAKWIRYAETIIPFAAVVLSAAIFSPGKMGPFKSRGWLILIIYLLSTFYFIPPAVEAHRLQTRTMKEVAAFLLATPAEIKIYTDYGSLGFLDIYCGRKRTILPLEDNRLKNIANAYVVINGSRGIIECEEMRKLLPLRPEKVPGSWRLVKTLPDPWIYKNKPYFTKIYFVPPVL